MQSFAEKSRKVHFECVFGHCSFFYSSISNGVMQNYIVNFPIQMSPIFMYNICICQSEAKYGREGMEMCYLARQKLGLNLQLGSST